MALKTIKEGWVEERVRSSQDWQKRWLVLTPELLCSYKFPDDLAPALSLKVSAITGASPYEKRESSFQLFTQKEARCFTVRCTQEVSN